MEPVELKGLVLRGCSKGRSDPRAEAYPQGYVEGLNDARTKLADFFNSLLVQLTGDGVCLKAASCR